MKTNYYFKKLFIASFLLFLSSRIHAQERSILLQKADSLLSADAFPEAFKALQALDSLKPTFKDSFEKTRLHVLWGEYYLTQNDYSASVAAYEPIKTVPVPADSAEVDMLAKGLNDLGIVYYKTGALEAAKQVHQQSIRLYEKIGSQLGLSFNYDNLGIIAKEQKQTELALKYFAAGLQAAQAINDSLGIGYLHMNLANAYGDSYNRLKSLEHFYQALKIFKAIEKPRLEALVQIKLAEMYIRLNSQDSAYALLQRAETFYKSSGSERKLPSLYFRKIQLFMNDDQLDSAEHYADLALEIAKRQSFILSTGKAYLKKGDVLKKEKQYVQAQSYYQKALEALGEKFKGSAFIARTEIAEVYFLQKRYPFAIQTSEEALKEMKHAPVSNSGIKAYEILYQSYKALNQPEEALNWLEKRISTEDSLFDKTQSLKIARMEYSDYLKLQEQQEAQKLENLKLTFEQKLARQRWIKYSALAGSAFLLMIVLMGYRLFANKKKALKLLSVKNKNIQAKNQELKVKNEEINALRIKEYNSQQRENQLLMENMASKENELAAIAMVNHAKNNILFSVNQKVKEMADMAEAEIKINLKQLKKKIDSEINTTDSWNSFVHQFETIHPHFFDQLKSEYPDLTVNDLKLCAYIKVGMNNKEIAQASHLALSSVKKNIYRLKKKLMLEPEAKIRDFMLNIQQPQS